MNKLPLIATLICMAGCLVINSAAYAGTGMVFLNENVAEVNGTFIKESEMFYLLIGEHGSEIWHDLVENQIIAGEAGTFGVSVEPGEIDDYLASAYSPEKLQQLKSAFGEDVLKATIGTEILALKTQIAKINEVISTNKLEVTDKQIQDFYLANLPLWIRPEAVRFSLIEVATKEEALKAKARINGGESFADVAKEISTHEASRPHGGDIGGLIPRGYSSGEKAIIEKTAFDLGIGEVSEPISAQGKWYLIMTNDKTSEFQPTLEQKKQEIRSFLINYKVEPYMENWRKELWDKAEVKIMYPLYQDEIPKNFNIGENNSYIAPIIAVVNGTKITEKEFFFLLLREYGSRTIEAMIDNELLFQEGKKLGIQVSYEEARAKLIEINGESLLAVLDKVFTPDLLNREMAVKMTGLAVIGKKFEQIVKEQGIQISDDQILQYFLDNLQRWSHPEAVRFSVIVTATEADAIRARERIVKGEDFTKVCQEASIDEITRAKNGDIGEYMPKGIATGETKIIEDAAFKLEVGEVSQPIAAGGRWFLIKVTDKKAAYEPTIREKQGEIRARLLRDRVDPFLKEWKRNLWKNVKINLIYPIFSEPAASDSE